MFVFKTQGTRLAAIAAPNPIGPVNQIKSRKVRDLCDIGFGCSTNKHKIIFVNLKQPFVTLELVSLRYYFVILFIGPWDVLLLKCGTQSHHGLN